MAAIQHWTFEKEIEARVYKKAVTCFVRSYDKTFQGNNVRAHSIVHMYSDVDAPAGTDKSAETFLLQGHSRKPMSDVETIHSQQLFSPTTKKVLEEISAKTALAQSSSAMIETAKRPLFGTNEDMASFETPLQIAGLDDSSTLAADGVDRCNEADGNNTSTGCNEADGNNA